MNSFKGVYKMNKNAFVIDGKGNKHNIPALWDEKRSRVSFGNTKTGIPSINLLAGDMAAVYDGCFPAVLKDTFSGICGTCNSNCPGCYAKKITRNIDPMIKYALNTMEAKEDPERFISLVEKELYSNPLVIYRVVRIHDSGDFFSDDYFSAIMDMVKRHPETIYGAYTKAETIVNNYGLDNLPKNLSLSCSPWDGHCNEIGDLPQFIYDDHTKPELATLPHCPAVDKNGKRTGIQCKDCLHCYHAKRGQKWAVYAH